MGDYDGSADLSVPTLEIGGVAGAFRAQGPAKLSDQAVAYSAGLLRPASLTRLLGGNCGRSQACSPPLRSRAERGFGGDRTGI